jgi:hypothetical protein
MKSIVISVLMLSMTLFFVGCENEGQPTENASDVETQILDKKIKSEWIAFTGNLVGGEEVSGCCPNRGPNPEYTLTLSGLLPPGTYNNGEIFMNSTGRQSPGDYLVKFWSGSMYLEIRGGEKQYDRRNKILTVTFENVPCEIWIGEVLTATVDVSFILTRAKL